MIVDVLLCTHAGVHVLAVCGLTLTECVGVHAIKCTIPFNGCSALLAQQWSRVMVELICRSVVAWLRPCSQQEPSTAVCLKRWRM